jgi:hypothetical protein
MTFDESSRSEFWSMYVTERTASDPAGTMETPVLANAGTASSRDSRVGDYSSTTVDPSDGLTFWSANEYQGSDFWDTHIASFSIAGAVHSPTIMATLPHSGPQQGQGQTFAPYLAAPSLGERDIVGQIIESQTGTQTVHALRVWATRSLDSFWANPANRHLFGLQW